jgi:hypothetical protein
MEETLLEIIPLGIIEGISSKTSKPFKFWRYSVPGYGVCSCSDELQAGDKVTITKSGDYNNLLKAAGAAFSVSIV